MGEPETSVRPCLLALCLILLASAPAAADEVFTLANDYIVRGRVVRETEDKLVVRLSGLMDDNTITIRRAEIVKRQVQEDPTAERVVRTTDADASDHLGWKAPAAHPRTVRFAADGRTEVTAEGLSEAEPELEREGFGQRLERVTRMAFPPSLEGRLLVGLLLFLALGAIVAGGARTLGMKSLSLHASSTLGLLLGVFLVGDILLHGELLRADRALWVLPLQAGTWLATARALLDAPLSRTIPLFSMVLFASMCFMFLTGSLLVAL
jgi:hypothetical protein